MFEHVMRNLREKVKELEDETFFDTILRQNTGPSLAQVPSSSDIQAIMRTMMPSSSSAVAGAARSQNVGMQQQWNGRQVQM